MKEYRITEESLEKCLKMIADSGYHGIYQAIKALCVPVESTGEEWENSSDLRCLLKGDYCLSSTDRWELRRKGRLDAFQPFSKIPGYCYTSAKKWADGIIEKIKKIEQSKPFGPGTRLRAPNGDEVMVIGNFSGQDGMVFNLNTNRAIALPDSCYWHSFAYLQNYLESAGYEIIE